MIISFHCLKLARVNTVSNLGDILPLRNGTSYQMTLLELKQGTNEVKNEIRLLKFWLKSGFIVIAACFLLLLLLFNRFLAFTVFIWWIIVYKITKIVRALWLAERRVCMRVCKHGCDVKMFCFSRANHASTNLKKVLSWKTRQVYFIYPFPRRLKLEKSLETCCVNFFSLELTF